MSKNNKISKQTIYNHEVTTIGKTRTVEKLTDAKNETNLNITSNDGKENENNATNSQPEIQTCHNEIVYEKELFVFKNVLPDDKKSK